MAENSLFMQECISKASMLIEEKFFQELKLLFFFFFFSFQAKGVSLMVLTMHLLCDCDKCVM